MRVDGAIAAAAERECGTVLCLHQPQAVGKIREDARAARSPPPASTRIEDVDAAVFASVGNAGDDADLGVTLALGARRTQLQQ